jgi:mannitol/fructose-specific phosphotransferase system IIA component
LAVLVWAWVLLQLMLQRENLDLVLLDRMLALPHPL